MVDIVSYLTVFHLFVAHMTGNTVHLGHNLVIGNWPEAAKAGSVLISFVAGSVIGRSIIEAGARRGLKRVATITLLMESALVLVVVWSVPLNPANTQVLDLGTVCWILVLLSAAMALQTATLTRIGPLTIHTTFVTGMLNKLAQGISEWLFWLHDEWVRNASWSDLWYRSRQHASLLASTFMFAIWVCYALGSLAGTWMDLRWSTRSLYVPVFLMAVGAAIDQFKPLSIEEEKDQV
jgi:uncharacterized membrane protein YoaK (UPF0700 family)